jgi:hypothetical protein
MDKEFSVETMDGIRLVSASNFLANYFDNEYKGERGGFEAKTRCVGLDSDRFVDCGDCTGSDR